LESSRKEAEVEFGTSLERRVLDRWLEQSNRNPSVVFNSGQYHDFDFGMLDSKGYPLAWVEVKVRRRKFGEYKDAMFPYRKHEFAKRLFDVYTVPCYGITLYACGTLIEVDLVGAPNSVSDVKRRDRPNSDPVPHGFYRGEQLVIYERRPGDGWT
jgi:hypothetical protein